MCANRLHFSARKSFNLHAKASPWTAPRVPLHSKDRCQATSGATQQPDGLSPIEIVGQEVAVSVEGQELNSSVNQGGSTSKEALYNCINILLGCGILTIPYALSEGGWSTLGVLLFMGVATNQTAKMLINLQEYYTNHPTEAPDPGNTLQFSNRTLQTYEDIAEMAFGQRGRQIISLILYTELLGTCALFLILQKDHVKMLLASSGWAIPTNDTSLLAFALLAVLPTTWLPDLSALSYVGAVGVLSTVCITGLLGYLYATQPASMPTDLIHVSSLPMTFGLIAFVFAGHAVFPAIYSSMKQSEKQEFSGVVDKSFSVVAVVCAAIGFAGYSMFGSETMEEVTLNLPPGWLQAVAFTLVLVSPFAKFALTLEPVAQGVEGLTKSSGLPLPTLVQKQGTRTALATSTLVMAAKVPFFGAFMSILGSFLTLSVSVLFPVLANLKMNWREMEDREKGANFIILGLGAFATVAGTSAALQSLGSSDAVSIQHTIVHHESVFKVIVCHALCEVV